MYWPNYGLPTFREQQSIFWKKTLRSLQLTSSSFLWHLLRPNWSIIRGAVSLWTFARIRNRWNWRYVHFQTSFKGSQCFEWLTKGTKRSVKMWTSYFYVIFFWIICCSRTEGSQKLVRTYVCYAPDGLFWTVLYKKYNTIQNKSSPVFNILYYLCKERIFDSRQFLYI